MSDPRAVYRLLQDYAARPDPIREVIIGPIWTLCATDRGLGLAMSPQCPSRTLAWSGSLVGRSVGEVAQWVTDWEPYRATVGMAAINAALADFPFPPAAQSLPPSALWPPNLAVFEHFLPQIAGKRVVVIGRYPDLDRLSSHCELTVVERQPREGDLPDPASEFVVPAADWVFVTGSALTNKTFPRLAELARNAQTVLMGPTAPWLPEMGDYGVDYLAGVEVIDSQAVRRTVAEGGGVRLFEGPLRYRVAPLGTLERLAWLKRRIAFVFAEKERLSGAMELWHQVHTQRFPEFAALESAYRRLSLLDSAYKSLWTPDHERVLGTLALS